MDDYGMTWCVQNECDGLPVYLIIQGHLGREVSMKHFLHRLIYEFLFVFIIFKFF